MTYQPIDNAHCLAERPEGESNDCTVRALACAAQIPYKRAHSLMAAAGRKRGQGLYPVEWLPVYAEAGKTLLHRDDYQGKTITTLTRWLKRQPGHAVFIVKMRGHVACFRAGEWQDWLKDSARRVVLGVWQVVSLLHDDQGEPIRYTLRDGRDWQTGVVWRDRPRTAADGASEPAKEPASVVQRALPRTLRGRSMASFDLKETARATRALYDAKQSMKACKWAWDELGEAIAALGTHHRDLLEREALPLPLVRIPVNEYAERDFWVEYHAARHYQATGEKLDVDHTK